MRNQIYLGSEELVEKAARQGASGGNLAEVTRAQRRSLAEPLAEYEQRYGDQHDAMARAYLSGAYSMQGVAAQFGVHYVTVSRAVRRHEQMESSKKRESDG